MRKIAQYPYNRPQVDYKRLLNVICQYTHVTCEDMRGEWRFKDIADARRMLYALLVEEGESCKKIAKFVGRHSSTVSECYRYHQRIFQTDGQYRETYIKIKEALK